MFNEKIYKSKVNRLKNKRFFVVPLNHIEVELEKVGNGWKYAVNNQKHIKQIIGPILGALVKVNLSNDGTCYFTFLFDKKEERHNDIYLQVNDKIFPVTNGGGDKDGSLNKRFGKTIRYRLPAYKEIRRIIENNKFSTLTFTFSLVKVFTDPNELDDFLYKHGMTGNFDQPSDLKISDDDYDSIISGQSKHDHQDQKCNCHYKQLDLIKDVTRYSYKAEKLSNDSDQLRIDTLSRLLSDKSEEINYLVSQIENDPDDKALINKLVKTCKVVDRLRARL